MAAEDLDPALQFHLSIPDSIDRALRQLARGQLELLRIPGIPYQDRALIMGQALALASIESAGWLQGEAEGLPPLSLERMREVQAWVQETMGRCYQDQVFRDILAFYDATLTLNSEREIQDAIEGLSSEIHLRLGESVDVDLKLYDSKKWAQLGGKLGQIGEGSAFGFLIYARAKGLVTDSSLERMGVDLPGLDRFRLQVLRQQRVNLAFARPKEVRAYLNMHLRFVTWWL